MGRPLILAAVAALVVATAGCASSGSDKAGGESRPARRVLTLEQHDSTYGGAQYADAVSTLSEGSLKVEWRPELAPIRVDFEREIIDDVRSGKADVGVVAVRVWDTLAVNDFQALLAPFLVDSLELEGKILESPAVAGTLTGIDRSGVVGVALLPGPLRRPFGYRRRLVGPDDYSGARIGVRPGRVEEATFRNLGASTRVYLTLDGASREGAALDLSSITGGHNYRGKTVAANVAFWPRVEAVIVNREAFAALTAAQKQSLRSAGRRALGPRLAEIERVEAEGLRSLCVRHVAALATASPAELDALEAAVRPVYAELERDARTRALIAEIRRLDDGRRPAPLRCLAVAHPSVSALVGTWASAVSRDELVAAGAPQRDAVRYQGKGRLELQDGRWTYRDARGTVAGRYAVSGDIVRLTIRTCSINPCTPGARVELQWSVYRDTLTFAPVAGRVSWARLTAKPARRVD
jgi:TRAP-type C4-dicarboxylate transport system substrate-binding protein